MKKLEKHVRSPDVTEDHFQDDPAGPFLFEPHGHSLLWASVERLYFYCQVSFTQEGKSTLLTRLFLLDRRVGMDISLEDFCALLDEAESADAVWAMVSGFVKDFGVDWAMYGFMDKPPPSATDLQLGGAWASYPEDWMKYYLENGYASYDVAVLHVINGGVAPVYMGVDLPFPGVPAPVEQKAKQVWHETSEFGMRSGVAFPLRWGGKNGCAAFGLASRLPGEEFIALLNAKGKLLKYAASFAHLKVQTLLLIDAENSLEQLTQKERECLQFAACGLKGATIAHRLGCSEKSVDHALERVRRKWGVKNTPEAVALAVTTGIIKT